MRRQHGKRGFTLMEVLISLAVLAMLMAAIGAAVHSSLQSYTENQKSLALTQAARSVLDRMMREVRTAADVDSTTNSLTIDADGTGQNTASYQFSPGAFYYVQTVDGHTTYYPLLSYSDDVNVTDFSVVREDSAEGNPLSVTVRLTLAMRDRTFAMTATSAVRRFQMY